MLREYRLKIVQLILFVTGVAFAYDTVYRPVTVVVTPRGNFMLSIASDGSRVVLSRVGENGGIEGMSEVVFQSDADRASFETPRLAIDSQGRILVAATRMPHSRHGLGSIEISRFQPTLERDSGFGNGKVSIRLSGRTEDQLSALTVRPNGSVVIAIGQGHRFRPFELERLSLVDVTESGRIDPESEFTGNGFSGREFLEHHLMAKPRSLFVSDTQVIVGGLVTEGERYRVRPFAISVDGVVNPMKVNDSTVAGERGAVHVMSEEHMAFAIPTGGRWTLLRGLRMNSPDSLPAFKTTVGSSLGFSNFPQTAGLATVRPEHIQVVGRDSLFANVVRVTEINSTGQITGVERFPGLIDDKIKRVNGGEPSESVRCRTGIIRFAPY